VTIKGFGLLLIVEQQNTNKKRRDFISFSFAFDHHYGMSFKPHRIAQERFKYCFGTNCCQTIQNPLNRLLDALKSKPL